MTYEKKKRNTAGEPLEALSPERPVKGAVLDGFGDVLGLQRTAALEIGHGARHFQDAVVGAGAEALLGHGTFQKPFAVGRKFAILADLAGRHLGVAINLLRG